MASLIVVGMSATHVTTALGTESRAAALFGEAAARESLLRRELAAATNASVVRTKERVRALSGAYEDLAALFPRSTYGADALWRGAILSADAFKRFDDPVDRTTALRLLRLLAERFPSSARIKDVPAQIAQLQTGVAAVTPRRNEAPKTDDAAANGAASEAPAASPAPPRRGVSLSRQLGLGIARIVIDPGHGGRDPGVQLNGLTEADVVLDVALRLEDLLRKNAALDVVLTRRDDTYVGLEERTATANRSGADLFLSIHANASSNTTASGIETYFLSFARSRAAEIVAARENAGSSRTMRNLPDLIKTIALNNKIDESRDFAYAAQTALFERLQQTNKQVLNLGVKQAPFVVLIDADMPSILAEVSFLTNRRERALLGSDKYRQQIAEALFTGIVRYQEARTPLSVVSNTR